MSRVRDVLRQKGHEVATVDRDATVLEAAVTMRDRHIGGVVVLHQGEIVGIFTERDVLNRVVAAGRDPKTTRVHEVMTGKVAICELDTTIEACRSVMSKNRIRHLPVMEGGELVGIISSRDILSREIADQEETIRYLHEYMHGG